MSLEHNVLVGGQLLYTHPKGDCLGEFCTIHNFSDHHMVAWKQMWDETHRRMMRICKHNIAHVDPDEITRNLEHHCDGCCDPANQFSEDFDELVRLYDTKPVSSSGVHMHIPTSKPHRGTDL